MRSEILPRIAGQWPHADASILHAARLCRGAADYIDRQASIALASLRREDDTLDAAGWLKLHDALRAPVLEAWLNARGLFAPPDASRAELERQAAGAARDSAPVVAWTNTEVRIWDGRLHAMLPLAALPEGWQAHWDGEPLALPGDCGELRLEVAKAAPANVMVQPLDSPLTVRFREGGERIKPAGDPHTRELRDLFQQARVPPWLRMRYPLIYENDALVAVADGWISERGQSLFNACSARPRWIRAA